MCRLCIKDWSTAISSHKKNFTVKKGDLIFSEGEAMNGVYFVFTGLVKVHKQWGEKKELIVRFAKDGDIVGHRGLGKENYFPVSATAIENSTLCYIDLEFFLSTLRVNQEFLYELMLFYAAELKESEEQMRNLAHMPVKGRIAVALITLEKKFGTDSDNNINIAISRQDLASYVGTSYETLFRMLEELVGESIVSTENKKISILSKEKLIQYLEAGK